MAAGKIAVLASGNGSTLEALHEAIKRGESDTKIAFIVCNVPYKRKSGSPLIYERAKRLGIKIYTVNNKTHPERPGKEAAKGAISNEASKKLVELAKIHGVELFVSLGYMRRLVGPALEFGAVNLHPGPLPLTAGLMLSDGQKKVMREGEPFSGPTFHWMSRGKGDDGLPLYDAGEIIGHWPVPVLGRHREEWKTSGTVSKLESDVKRVERTAVPLWIDRALDQIK